MRTQPAAPSASTGLTEPSLLVALQAQEQEQSPSSNDAAPNLATTVNAPAKDDQNAAPDPTATFVQALSVQDASAQTSAVAIAAARPGLDGPATGSKGADGSATLAGATVALPDVASPSPTASSVAIGFAATAAGPLGQAGSGAPNPPAGPTTPATLPAVQLALAITHSVANGAQSFTLQLKPERLGTVDVKLDLDAKGRATASFVADRPETLALLRQDAHHLVKSLNDAGVNADAGSLNFSLRNSGESFGQAQERRNGSGQAPRQAGLGQTIDADAELPIPAIQGSGANRLYDIRA